jgi:hypothetical protein
MEKLGRTLLEKYGSLCGKTVDFHRIFLDNPAQFVIYF